MLVKMLTRFVNGWFAAFHLCFAEFVVSVNKNLNDRLQCFQLAAETAASTCQNGNVVTQIGVDAFDIMRVAFVPYVTNVASGVYYIKIAHITVRAILFCPRRAINDGLDMNRVLVELRLKSNDLPWFAADYRHQIDVFTGS